MRHCAAAAATRDAAFATLGILAVAVSGGAAAGVAPEVLGAGIGGLSVGGTATAVSVGAPIVANVGGSVLQVAYGDKVDWDAIAVDTAIQVALTMLGGRLGEWIFGRLAGQPEVQTLARRAVASMVSGVATHEESQLFTVVVHQAYDALRGRKVTWAGFGGEMLQRLTDPKGLFMAMLMSGAQLGAHVAMGRLAPKPPAGQLAAPARLPPAGQRAPKQPVPARPGASPPLSERVLVAPPATPARPAAATPPAPSTAPAAGQAGRRRAPRPTRYTRRSLEVPSR